MQTVENIPSHQAASRAWLDAYEERIWGNFYRRIRDPSMAAEVVRLMDEDAMLKRGSPGLYLCAKATLARQAKRQAAVFACLQAFQQVTGVAPIIRTDPSVSEQALWARLYRKVRDPVVAKEIVEYLDRYSWRHEGVSGLYLQARQTLHRHHVRRERWASIARFMRTLLVGAPASAPAVVNTAATEQAERLFDKPAFADARATFDREVPDKAGASESGNAIARAQAG